MAKDGQALMPVAIATNASQWSRDAAVELTNYLDQITGAKFAITNGTEQTPGIVVGNMAALDFHRDPSRSLPWAG